MIPPIDTDPPSEQSCRRNQAAAANGNSGDRTPSEINPGNCSEPTHTAAVPTQPDTAARFGHLFHLIDDAVVEIKLVDTTPIVIAVNPAFEDIFGYDHDTVVGESLNDFIVPDGDDESEAFDQRTARGKENTGIVERKTATGLREFFYKGVPYEGSDGSQYGFAIYSDLTEQRRYEKHSKVLNRLFRHNLRNELSVVLSIAGYIADYSDDSEIAELAARMHRRASRLETIGRETKALQQLLEQTHEPTSLDIAGMCKDVISGHSDGGRVEYSIPAALEAKAIPELENAIEAVLDNALRHGGDRVICTVAKDAESETVSIEISDDGPGIPAQERKPVFADAEITQLEHGSGIGLWLVRWTVETCGGTLAYERSDDGWTTVRLVLLINGSGS